MAIPFKRVGRKDPRKIDGVLKYHPQLVTMGQSVDLDSIASVSYTHLTLPTTSIV